MDGFGRELSMPLLEGDDFFKNLDTMEQDFINEDEIQDYDENGDLELEGEDVDDEESFLESPDYPDTPVEKLSRQEQLRMMHLRSHLNQLTEKVKHHQYMTEKTRDELKQCRGKITELEEDRNIVREELHQADTTGNQSAGLRLRAQHDKLSEEISNEKEIEKLIMDRLEKEEYELAKVDVERGKFLLAEDELIKKEDRLAKEKTELAMQRLRKEEKKAKQAEKNLRRKDRQYQEIMKESQERHFHRVESAEKSKQKHKKFVDDTMKKMKQRQEEENTRYKEEMERKMNMLLKLKNDITSNRENLKALRARDKAAKRQDEYKKQEVRQKILDEGGNPDEILLIQKRINDHEKQKLTFEGQQKEKHAAIMEKILIEEDRMRRRKVQQPLLWEDPKREKSKIIGPQKKKPLKTFEEYQKMSLDSDLSLDLDTDTNEEIEEKEDADTEKIETEDTGVGDQPTDRLPREDDSSDSSDDENKDYNVPDLAKPEFEGLWDHHKPYKVPKDTNGSPLKLPGASKMDKAILDKVLEKHRAGIVVKQVAAGREFSGCPFYSKPDVIHFKDFDVGKTYKKKVALTNVSYTVNYCKYLDITERLKDFISIHFDPPGQMSAGLTCEMLVTFKPMINEDLEGEVKFLSQTGPFSIPLKCTTKKCDLSVDMDVIQFGTTVIDETLKKTFTLTNKGALGTTFQFFKVTGMKAKTATSVQTSLGRMTTAESVQAVTPDATDQDKSKKDTTITGETTEKKQEGEEEGQGQATEGKDDDGAPEGTEAEGQQGEDDRSELEDTSDYSQDTSSVISKTESPVVKLSSPPKHPNCEGEEAGSPDLAISEYDDYGTLDGMKVGPIAAGEIGPFASTKLEIIWNPTVPGKVDSEFLVNFADPLSDSISVRALGNAIDVPVWVERQSVDLKICMYDRLYQDTIIVNNRATTALRLKFEVCKELRNHLELLPKTGYIQAQSQFSAQLKFLPRKGLPEEALKYFDPETGVLEAPMTIRVADQTAPVPFTVQAVVTNSDMEFDVQDINFGCCTIYESVQTTIKLTNKSILPQEFGFVGHPEYVEVQPNDGFGTLLPLETIELDVIFSPKKARDYKFELNCKSVINREFKIQCVGVGVHPPLDLSNQVIHFGATALYDVSTARIDVINSHTSMNEFTHPVPRIGKGEIAPVGPTSFEFVVPKDAPLTISPSVGTIQPGEKSSIQVRFAPLLEEDDIRREAVRMATKQMEQQAEREYKEALKKQKEAEELAVSTDDSSDQQKAPAKGKGGAGKGQPPKGKQTPGGNVLMTVTGPSPVTPPKPEDISKDSTAYASAVGSLLRQFRGKFQSFTVPCYVASGECTNPGELPYSTKNTLYLEIHCPVIKPPLVVISDSGKTTTDFGDISIGQNSFKSVTIQNISHRTVELQSSSLDTAGPFQVMNAFRILPPDATHTMLVSFTPHAGQVFREELLVHGLTSSLYITLTGKGVTPFINLQPNVAENGVMDMGSVLAGEYLEKTFKMQNGSSLSIDYQIRLESLSLLRHAHAQDIPPFINKNNKSQVGVQNNNGQNVFDLVPAEGKIAPGGFTEITVTFSPDHASDFYSDGVRIELFGKEESHAFRIKGTAKSKIMYMEGGEPLYPNVESLCVKPTVTLEEEDVKQQVQVVLVTLQSVFKEDTYIPGSRDIHIGCVRTMAVSQKKVVYHKDVKSRTVQERGKYLLKLIQNSIVKKEGHLNSFFEQDPPKPGYKNGEFTFDNIQQIAQKGFNIDPQKGMVEAGMLKPITITWTPPQGHNPNEMLEASIMVTLKGDVSEQYRILLRAMVVSE